MIAVGVLISDKNKLQFRKHLDTMKCLLKGDFMRIRLILALTAVVLAACGGGGGNTNPAVADGSDKYVGNWVSECRGARAGAVATKQYYVFVKKSATELNYTFSKAFFSGTSCVGEADVVESVGTFTLAGTKSARGNLTVITADLLSVLETVTDGLSVTSPKPTKNIGNITNGEMFFGDLVVIGGIDSDGYPSGLTGAFVYKQQAGLPPKATPDFTSKYVGSWASNCYISGGSSSSSSGGSVTTTITFYSVDDVSVTRFSGKRMDFALQKRDYGVDSTCAGAGTLTASIVEANLVHDGTAIADGKSVDRFAAALINRTNGVSGQPRSARVVLRLEGGQIQLGVAPELYPTVLEPGYFWTRK
jgi:hypothetical protein